MVITSLPLWVLTFLSSGVASCLIHSFCSLKRNHYISVLLVFCWFLCASFSINFCELSHSHSFQPASSNVDCSHCEGAIVVTCSLGPMSLLGVSHHSLHHVGDFPLTPGPGQKSSIKMCEINQWWANNCACRCTCMARAKRERNGMSALCACLFTFVCLACKFVDHVCIKVNHTHDVSSSNEALHPGGVCVTGSVEVHALYTLYTLSY